MPFFVKSTRNGKTHCGLTLSTRKLPCFNEIYELFYINKVKIVPDNIFEYLTPIALAH